ncbi:MAG: DUF373 family protein, partial [Fervidicoccaceae archaeon]
RLSEKKILLLVIDRDNDIEKYTGLKAPIIGKEELLKAAIEFAKHSPEDSDLNVMFSGLQLLEKMIKEGYNTEIALVAGDESDPVKGDLRIRNDVERLKRELSVDGAIVISDGTEDEVIIPVLQSIIPIISVRRVVVEQLRGVEETYILLGKYIRKAIFEPRFSRIFLGVPGILLLSLVILSFIGYLQYATLVIGIILSGAMIVRGFNLEEKIYEYWASSPIMFVSSSVATILIVTGTVLFFYTVSSSPSIYSVGSAIENSSPIFGLSIFAILVGRGIIKLINRSIKVWRDIIGMILTLIFVFAFMRFGDALSSRTEKTTLDALHTAIFSSGFLDILVIGIGAAGLLTVAITYIEKKYFEK